MAGGYEAALPVLTRFLLTAPRVPIQPADTYIVVEIGGRRDEFGDPAAQVFDDAIEQRVLLCAGLESEISFQVGRHTSQFLGSCSQLGSGRSLQAS
ncbi:hypothetical protein OEZ60_18850 [Defluviimonas sp. WL0024]|uniref:Uncharacterized protein n=1 Tax=Albidovulum salinarum TaxID=2984153 RepID=A0ABT2X7Y2_9RHOB|nr:hypothetical protein [Defluviimonas sp. WL0024]